MKDHCWSCDFAGEYHCVCAEPRSIRKYPFSFDPQLGFFDGHVSQDGGPLKRFVLVETDDVFTLEEMK